MSRSIPILIALKLLLTMSVAYGAQWQVETLFGTVTSDDMAFENFVGMLLNGLYSIIGLLTIIRIILGGYRYIQASGNPAEAKAAKRIILHAVSGLVLVFLAFLITTFVTDLFVVETEDTP